MDCQPWTNNITPFRNVPSCEKFYRWSCIRPKGSWCGYDRGWRVWIPLSTCYPSQIPYFYMAHWGDTETGINGLSAS